MLAEELHEKGETISELEGVIEAYELKYGVDNNVLDDDIVALKKEVEALQTVRDRLESDLMKKGDKLEGLEAKEKAVNEKLTKLEEEINICRWRPLESNKKNWRYNKWIEI